MGTGSYRIRPSTKTYPPENHTQKLNRENTPMHKNHYPRGNHTCAHTKIDPPENHICAQKQTLQKQYQNHNLQNVTLPPPSCKPCPFTERRSCSLCQCWHYQSDCRFLKRHRPSSHNYLKSTPTYWRADS